MMPSQAPAAIAFRLRRRFHAARHRVFHAWTDPDALRQWWCPAGWAPEEIEMDLRPGGEYRIGMRRAGSGPAVYVCGRFLEVRAPERLVYTWQWENAFEEMPQTRVTVEFNDVSGATEVVLFHEGLLEIPICLHHRTGWLHALERLELLLGAPAE